MGCLPPFKSLFSARFSTSNRYKVSSGGRSGGRNGSIPLNTPDAAYQVRARGRKSDYWDNDSQTKIVKKDEELGDGAKMGEGEIMVERVFVSWIFFLQLLFPFHLVSIHTYFAVLFPFLFYS